MTVSGHAKTGAAAFAGRDHPGNSSSTPNPGVPPRRIILKAALICTLALLLAGGVLDVNRLASDRQKPKVTFALPAAWRCDRQQSALPTAEGRLEPCTVCQNMARTPQAVTINKTEQPVPPQGHVAMCHTSAFRIAE